MRTPAGGLVRVKKQMVYPLYFETMGQALRAGRDFAGADLSTDGAPVGIVNETFVREVMKGESPLGRIVEDGRGNPREVIGIVADSRYASLRGATPPVMYQTFLQTRTGRGQMTLHVRVDANVPDIAARIRREVQRTDASMPLPALETLALQVDTALSRERLVATLSTAFAALALALACVGLYGLLSFVIRRPQRRNRHPHGPWRRSRQRPPPRDARRTETRRRWSRDWRSRRDHRRPAVGEPHRGFALPRHGNRSRDHGRRRHDTRLLATFAAYLPAARAARMDPLVALRSE